MINLFPTLGRIMRLLGIGEQRDYDLLRLRRYQLYAKQQQQQAAERYIARYRRGLWMWRDG